MFGRGCYVVRHPLLRSYIASLVSSVKAALQKRTAQGQALKLVLVILDPTQQRCVERVVFDCRVPLHGGHGEDDEKRAGGATPVTDSSAAALTAQLRSQLGDALGKLALCNSLLTALPSTPPTCTFTFLLYTNTPHVSAASAAGQAPPHPPAQSTGEDDSAPHWLPVELSGQGAAAVGGGSAGGGGNDPSSAAVSSLWSVSPSPWLIDIRSIRSPVLECEIYIQEATDKRRPQKGA